MNYYYDMLGVARDATRDEIRSAYRARAKESHPDRGGDPVRMGELNVAFTVLYDPESRRKYDEGDESLFEDPEELQVQKRVVEAFGHCVERLSEDYWRGDVMATARDYLREQAGKVARGLIAVKVRQERLSRMEGVVVRAADGDEGDGPNLFEGVLRQAVDAASDNRRKLETMASVLEAAAVELASYSEVPSGRLSGIGADRPGTVTFPFQLK